MPAFTPRGYPYSVPTDPADVPGAIQDLAEAIDPDIQARADAIHARPAFRLSSTSPVVFPTWIAFTNNQRLPFENQDALVEGAIAPIQGSTGRIVPLLPGFWWFHASWSFPRTGATLMNFLGISLQTSTQVLARNSTHIAPPLSDGANNMTVSAGTFFNGTTDYIEVIGSANVTTPGAGNPAMTIRNRYLFGMRMRES